MKGPMTVLHVLDHSVPLHSGYSYRSQSIVEFQRRLGLRPVVLTSPKHGSEADGVETIEGLRYYRTARERGRVPFVREFQLMARMASRVAAVARAERAALIHAHSPVLNGLPALWAARHLNLPVVYEARAFWEDAAVDQGKFREGSGRYRLIRALETYLFKRADRVAVICEGMRQELVTRHVDGRRVIVIPNGVDTNAFQPVTRAYDLAARYGLDGGLTLGYFGSFYHYEGLRFLLEALPDLRRHVPGARLLLAGGGEEEATLRRLGEPLGNAVVFAGRVPHADIRRLYSVIDVFVCPRRRMRLTELVTPLKPLEAMAMGIPVLASDIGGHAELVSDGETGLLFKAESPESLVEQASRLGRDPELRAQLGAGGRRWVESERTWERIVTRYLPIYGVRA